MRKRFKVSARQISSCTNGVTTRMEVKKPLFKAESKGKLSFFTICFGRKIYMSKDEILAHGLALHCEVI